MAFLDKLGELAKSAADKANDSLEINRINSDIVMEQGNIQVYQTDLGKYYWAKFVMGEKLDDEAMHICDKIVAAQDKIRALETEIETIKADREAEKAERAEQKRQEAEQAAKEAAERVEEKRAQQADSVTVDGERFCGSCGAPLSEEQKFCGNCGKPVDNS